MKLLSEVVIWGAGYLGELMLRYFTNAHIRVLAFIDSDEKKQGYDYHGVPVIDFETYKKNYCEKYIIIAVDCIDEIDRNLLQNNIYNFSNIKELPSGIQTAERISFCECYGEMIEKNGDTAYIYGLNAFGLMLCDLLQTYGYKNVHIVLQEQMEEKKKEYYRGRVGQFKISKDIECDSENAVVYLAVREDTVYIKKRFNHFKIIDAFNFGNQLEIFYHQELEQLYAIHREKRRCFIVATGPSLRESDIECLRKNNEFSISVNKIYHIENAWRPDIYVCTDSYFIKTEKESILEYECSAKIIADHVDGFWDEQREGVYPIHVIASDIYDVPPCFSENICQNVYGSATVIYVCIQIAVYMGFKEIYLLGVDCNYHKGSKNNYFFKSEQDFNTHRVDQMVAGYKSARRYCDAHDIRIFNATRGGKLEVFERVDFDSLFEQNGDQP